MKLRTILALSILATIAGFIIFVLLIKFGWSAIWVAFGAASLWWSVNTAMEDL